METLSWMFFCLSPFALFCSEDGTGLILCPVFIILGFIFKALGNKTKRESYIDSEGKRKYYRIKKDKQGNTQVIFEVDPSEFWEWHYKDRMRSTLAQKDSIGDGLMASRDQEARQWATTICGYHNAPVPPEAKQEQIARSNGVITKQIVKERAVEKDKIQVGKYLLMNELMKKHSATRVGIGGRNLCYCPQTRIKRDIDKIKTSNNSYITEYWAYNKYKKSVKEIWDGLSEEEKSQAARWVEEYERRLMNVAREYVEKKRNNDNIDMDF